jgi:Uma2 family endonuclease
VIDEEQRMATVPRILTYEEWLQMPAEHDGREEVVNGELFVMPPNKYTHAEMIRGLIDAFSPRIDREEVRVLESSVSLMINPDPLTCRAPDLLVEVLSLSETRRRKQRKLDDYARIGVPEVWIVSPEAQHVMVHVLADANYRCRKSSPGATSNRPVSPGSPFPFRNCGRKMTNK